MITAWALVFLIHTLHTAHSVINNPVAIVGGGIAGLAAFDKLKTLGFTSITILEGSDRIGGRVKPVQYPSAGTASLNTNAVLDLGAQFIHGRVFNPVYDRASTLGMLATPAQLAAKTAQGPAAYYTENGCQVTGALLNSMTNMFQKLDDDVMMQVGQPSQTASLGTLYDTAYQNYLSQQTNPPTAFYNAAYRISEKQAETEMGALDWHGVSAQSWQAYAEPPSDAQIYLNSNGFKPMLDDFLNKVTVANVRFGKEVTNINYNNPATVQLTMRDGTTMNADHVIVTSSLGYLKANAGSLFSPSLSSNAMSSINGMGYQTFNRIYLIYSTPFWPITFSSQYFLRVGNNFWNCSLTSQPVEDSLSMIFWYFEAHPTLPNVLQAVIAGNSDPSTSELPTSTELMLNMAATRVLRRFMNNGSIPFPNRVFWSKWGSDPLYFGSRSFYPPNCGQTASCSSQSVCAPVTVNRNGNANTPAVLLAGEACRDDLQGTVQGAWLSGEDAAQNLFNFYVPPTTNG